MGLMLVETSFPVFNEHLSKMLLIYSTLEDVIETRDNYDKIHSNDSNNELIPAPESWDWRRGSGLH